MFGYFLYGAAVSLDMDTTPGVKNRVQIAPLGFEYVRLKEPILQWKADVVVPIGYRDSERDPSYLDELLAELKANARIEVDQRECDIFDLFDTLGTVSKAINDYATDDVFVNISAGSKITAIAGMIACMSTGARPLYARPEYGPEGSRIPDTPLHEEVSEIFELPRYPIDRPSDLHIAFMSHIDDQMNDDTSGRYRGVSKKALIQYALDQEFRFIIESETTSDKGYYRLLDRHVLDLLSEARFVESEKIGRKKVIRLTPDGRNVLRAFRYAAPRPD